MGVHPYRCEERVTERSGLAGLRLSYRNGRNARRTCWAKRNAVVTTSLDVGRWTLDLGMPHSGMSNLERPTSNSLVGAPVAEHRRHRPQDDLQVQPERPVANVVQIE